MYKFLVKIYKKVIKKLKKTFFREEEDMFLKKKVADFTIYNFNKLLFENDLNCLVDENCGYKIEDFKANLVEDSYYSVLDDYNLNFRNEYQLFEIEKERVMAEKMIELIDAYSIEDKLLIDNINFEMELLHSNKNTVKKENKSSTNSLSSTLAFLSMQYGVTVTKEMNAELFYSFLKNIEIENKKQSNLLDRKSNKQ